MLLAASYLFYGWWDERFLFLIVLSTAIDFCSGIVIDEGTLTKINRAKASAWTLISAVAFLGINWNAPELSQKLQYATGMQYCSGVLLLVIAGNLLYPLLANLPEAEIRVFCDNFGPVLNAKVHKGVLGAGLLGGSILLQLCRLDFLSGLLGRPFLGGSLSFGFGWHFV